MRRAPHQQVPDLVGHRPSEQDPQVPVGPLCEPLHPIDVHRREHAGARRGIDQRGAERLVVGARRVPRRAHQAHHQLTAAKRHRAAPAARRRARDPRHLHVGRAQRLRRNVERRPQRALWYVCVVVDAHREPGPRQLGAACRPRHQRHANRHQSQEPAHPSLPSPPVADGTVTRARKCLNALGLNRGDMWVTSGDRAAIRERKRG